MSFKSLTLALFYFGKTYATSGADGWATLDDLPVPTGECVLDSDLSSYIFTCNSDGTLDEDFYDGVTDCSGTATTTSYSSGGSMDFDCDTGVGYVEVDLKVYTGCAIDSGYSSFMATGVCHYSSFESTYVVYSCDSTDLTVTKYSDSDCSTQSSTDDYTSSDCYYIGTVEYSGSTLSAYAAYSDCEDAPTTTVAESTSTTTEGPEPSASASTTEESSTVIMTTQGSSMDETTTTGQPLSVELSDYVGAYFNYSIFGIDIPLPTGVCVPIALDGLSTIYGIAECTSDGSQVSLTAYTTDDCSGTGELQVTYTANEDAFDCYGSQNYASMGLYINDACTSNVFNLYAATGQCFYFGYAYTAVTCDEEDGSVTLWAFGDSDCTNVYGKVKFSGDDCITEDGVEYNGIQLYIASGVCVVQGPTMSPTDRPTDSPALGGSDPDTTDEPFISGANGIGSKIGFVFATVLMLVAAVTIV